MRERNTTRACLIVASAFSAVAPGAAYGCNYHWVVGLAEPAGVWPAATSAQDALARMRAADLANDGAVDGALGSGGGGMTFHSSPIVTDPGITSWMLNGTTKGHSTDGVVNSVVSLVVADCQTVAYTSSNVYVKMTGIPSHALGSYGSDPAIPINVNRTVDIPRTVTVIAGKTNTPMGNIGVGINGVAFYNALDAMSYQGKNVWLQNANVFESNTYDGGPGHPSPLMNQTVQTSAGTKTAGNYHYHEAPTALVNEVDPGNTGQHASPVIGYAFDGVPIFGPYGYANADGTGGVVLMTSSYALRNITARTTLPDGSAASSAGPNVSATYPLGCYAQDYVFTSGLGLLDTFNGRFAVAPGYPNGVYGYYVTETSGGAGVYPYVIGPQYYGVPSADDLAQGGTITVPGNVTYYSPVVPEPGSAAMVVAAMPLLARRRR